MGKGNRLRGERKAPAGAKNTSSRGRAAAARAAKKKKAQREKILRYVLCGAAALAVVAAVIVLAVGGAKDCGRKQNAVSGGDAVTVERADEGAPDFFRAGEYEYDFSNSAYRAAFDESLLTLNDCFDENGFTTFAPDLNEPMVSVTLGAFDAEKGDDPAEDLRQVADNLGAFGAVDGFCLSSGSVGETRMAAASFRLTEEETGVIYTNTLRKLIRGKRAVLVQMCWDDATTDEQKAAMTEVFYSADIAAQ